MAGPQDTIVAQATATGRGGVGIVRVSGPEVTRISECILGYIPVARQAVYETFLDGQKQPLDQGIALRFVAPNSFTGEDVLELQGHGGPVVMNMLIRAIIDLGGVRLANPGEFSERAFLNDKMDLAQAEAIADLIDASSEHAARGALRSMQGAFSNAIQELVDQVIALRMYVEAAIDFPEEEIDFLSDGKVATDLSSIIAALEKVQYQAKQGSLIREGMRVVIAGRPNAGKSSLLNALAGRDAAIVTDVAGTTRDILKEHIHIDGMPLHIIDTAGLRDSPDVVEQIGIERAWREISEADHVLLMVDSSQTEEVDPTTLWPEFVQKLPKNIPLTLVRNKSDLSQLSIGKATTAIVPTFNICAREQTGIDALKQHLSAEIGYHSNAEGQFTARARHLFAIERAAEHLYNGQHQLHAYVAGELLAEELRLCQQHLNEITGEFSSDDLLGRIFSSFCIGK